MNKARDISLAVRDKDTMVVVFDAFVLPMNFTSSCLYLKKPC